MWLSDSDRQNQMACKLLSIYSKNDVPGLSIHPAHVRTTHISVEETDETHHTFQIRSRHIGCTGGVSLGCRRDHLVRAGGFSGSAIDHTRDDVELGTHRFQRSGRVDYRPRRRLGSLQRRAIQWTMHAPAARRVWPLARLARPVDFVGA